MRLVVLPAISAYRQVDLCREAEVRNLLATLAAHIHVGDFDFDQNSLFLMLALCRREAAVIGRVVSVNPGELVNLLNPTTLLHHNHVSAQLDVAQGILWIEDQDRGDRGA